MKFKITATHPKFKGKIKIFIWEGYSSDHAGVNFASKHPNLAINSIDLISEDSPCTKCTCSPSKQRSYYKVRLCQIRGNLQSMTDSETPLLTPEELIQLQRITCKIDKVISQFGMKTMDLKREGIL